MYLPVATQIPDRPGRIIRKVKSGTTYIYYQYGQPTNPKNGMPSPSGPASASWTRAAC